VRFGPNRRHRKASPRGISALTWRAHEVSPVGLEGGVGLTWARQAGYGDMIALAQAHPPEIGRHNHCTNGRSPVGQASDAV